MERYDIDWSPRKDYIRSTPEENREYAEFMRSQGMESVPIELPGGKRGFEWKRRRDVYRATMPEPLEAPIGPPAFGEPPTHGNRPEPAGTPLEPPKGERFRDGLYRDEDQRFYPEEQTDHEKAKRLLGGL